MKFCLLLESHWLGSSLDVGTPGNRPIWLRNPWIEPHQKYIFHKFTRCKLYDPLHFKLGTYFQIFSQLYIRGGQELGKWKFQVMVLEITQTTTVHEPPPLNEPVQVCEKWGSSLPPFCWGLLPEASRMEGGKVLQKPLEGDNPFNWLLQVDAMWEWSPIKSRSDELAAWWTTLLRSAHLQKRRRKRRLLKAGDMLEWSPNNKFTWKCWTPLLLLSACLKKQKAFKWLELLRRGAVSERDYWNGLYLFHPNKWWAHQPHC